MEILAVCMSGFSLDLISAILRRDGLHPSGFGAYGNPLLPLKAELKSSRALPALSRGPTDAL